MLEFLKGKKTYIMVAVAAVYSALIGLGYVPSIDYVWTLIGAGAVGTLRAGLPK